MNAEGWICPKCGAVMAPFMPYCKNCDGASSYSATAAPLYCHYDGATAAPLYCHYDGATAAPLYRNGDIASFGPAEGRSTVYREEEGK